MTDLRSDIVINGTRIHNRLVMPPKCGQWFDFSMGLQARS